jgi:hypothetical protein
MCRTACLVLRLSSFILNFFLLGKGRMCLHLPSFDYEVFLHFYYMSSKWDLCYQVRLAAFVAHRPEHKIYASGELP